MKSIIQNTGSNDDKKSKSKKRIYRGYNYHLRALEIELKPIGHLEKTVVSNIAKLCIEIDKTYKLINRKKGHECTYKKDWLLQLDRLAKYSKFLRAKEKEKTISDLLNG